MIEQMNTNFHPTLAIILRLNNFRLSSMFFHTFVFSVPLKKNVVKPGLKRPKNGFIRFAMKFRKSVADEHPNLDNREISRILGVRWRKLSMPEKYAYE